MCLKSPQIRDLNYMTKSEQTLPECCRAHRRWGKPAPERDHALRIMTSNKRTSAETLFKFCRAVQVQRGFNVEILTPLISDFLTA